MNALRTLCFAALCFGPLTAHANDTCTPIQQTASPYTPQAGTPERKAIFNALRNDMTASTGWEMIFVVNHLKVFNGWAFTMTNPESPDGQNHYEPVSALMHQHPHSGCWYVASYAASDSPDEPFSDVVARLRDEFPEAPAGIFPRP